MRAGAKTRFDGRSALPEVRGTRLARGSRNRTRDYRDGNDCAGGGGLSSEPRLMEVRRKVLKENDVRARELRERFHRAGVCAISLVSSPGSGKTTLLERVLTDMQPRYQVAALVGDLATENDAVRLARSGALVRQITTGTVCHLDASMVEKALADWDLGQFDFLFLENGVHL